MKVSRILNRAVEALQDGSITDEKIIEDINSALLDIAGRLCIPGLAVNAKVTAAIDVEKVLLPVNYHHDLYLVTTEAYDRGVVILPNFKSWAIIYPYDLGHVKYVTVDFTNLYYKPKPKAAEELTLYYYKKPDEVDQSDDVPVYIPDHLQQDLLLYYVLKTEYQIIEDGINGQPINMIKYSNLYEQAFRLFSRFYPYADKQAVNLDTRLNFF